MGLSGRSIKRQGMGKMLLVRREEYQANLLIPLRIQHHPDKPRTALPKSSSVTSARNSSSPSVFSASSDWGKGKKRKKENAMNTCNVSVVGKIVKQRQCLEQGAALGIAVADLLQLHDRINVLNDCLIRQLFGQSRQSGLQPSTPTHYAGFRFVLGPRWTRKLRQPVNRSPALR